MAVTYNQKGYVGKSMSVRAAAAYDGGEMPKSKWTKAAMLSAVEAFCDEECLFPPDGLAKMKKDEVFAEFFRWSSWHHTGRFANETEFYALDEDAVRGASRPITLEALERMAEALRIEDQMREDQERARREEYRMAHRGLSRDEIKDLSALMGAYPELFGENRISKSGKATITDTLIKSVFGKSVSVIADQSGPHYSARVSERCIEAAIDGLCRP